MTQEKMIEVLNFIKDVDCSNEQKRLMLEMAANTITVDKLSGLYSPLSKKRVRLKIVGRG